MCEKWIQTIPVVSQCNGIIILILNILFPGLGTMILACMSPNISGEQLLIGMLQFLFFIFFFVGILWSIWWSILVLQKTGQTPEIVIVPSSNMVVRGYPYNPITTNQTVFNQNKTKEVDNFQSQNHFDKANNFQSQNNNLEKPDANQPKNNHNQGREAIV
jgi:hypothetical protein